MIVMSKKTHSIMILASIVLGFVLAGSCVGLISLAKADYEVEGIPVQDSPFRDLVDNNGCMPSFQMQEMIVYNPTYLINSTLWDKPLISCQTAFESAHSFLELNINESFLEQIHIEWSDLVGNRPTWALAITGPNLTTSVQVNAISGDVIGWILSSLDSSVLNLGSEENHRVTASIAEEVAYNFLKNNNYSIPSSARYIGVTQYHSEPSGSHFYVIFKHYERRVGVGVYPFEDFSPEGIIIKIHERLGVVTQFSYKWTMVGDIPASNLISEYDAQDIALNNYYPNASVVGRQLILGDMFTLYAGDESPQIRLAWYIVVLDKVSDGGLSGSNTSGYRVDLLVDAFSGEYLEAHYTNSYFELPELQYYPITRLYLVLMFALAFSIFTALSTKWFVTKNSLSG